MARHRLRKRYGHAGGSAHRQHVSTRWHRGVEIELWQRPRSRRYPDTAVQAIIYKGGGHTSTGRRVEGDVYADSRLEALQKAARLIDAMLGD